MALHNDVSHDQRLDQTFQLGNAQVRVAGGTTKCARLALGFAMAYPERFRGKRVLELGSGAGLVGIGLAVALSCDVELTDQAPTMELLQHNIDQNTDPDRHSITASVLQWGRVHSPRDIDLVIGADLHFARESAPALWEVLESTCGVHQELILATIRRADWEGEMLQRLNGSFEPTLLAEADEVQLWSYRRRA